MERPPAIRPGVAADGAALTDIFLRSRAEAMPWLRRMHSDRSTRWFIDHVVLAELDVWVAERDDPVGFVAVRPGWIEHLYVAPEHQASGVGRALLGRAIERAGPGAFLRVFRRNRRAVAFYAGRGFVVEEEGDGRDNEEGEPDLLLRGPGPEPAWW